MSPDYLAHLRSDSARFAEVLDGTDPDAPVPPCTDWTAADLLWHLSEVQHFWGTIVSGRLTVLDTYSLPERPDGYPALLDFFADASTRLIETLAATADEVAVWTWLEADHTVGFVRRRQAHEALIHRLDAELTADAVTELDAALATDGVLEALEWMFGGAPEWANTTVEGPVGRLSTADTGASWLVQMGHWTGTNPDSDKSHTAEAMLVLVDAGVPTFEVTGTARDLDAWIWNRPVVGEISRTGDTSAFEAVIGAGVQ